MANRTFLISTDVAAKPIDGQDRIEIQCAASYMIPVFWDTLFDRSSVITTSADTEDGEKVEYPYLSRRAADAIAAAKTRWPALRQSLGFQYDKLFETWMGFVEQKSDGFLQCETVELWMMFDNTPSFQSHLEQCLGVFDTDPPDVQSAGWLELLGQANALNDKRVAPAGEFSFCGYGWDVPVPWEENDSPKSDDSPPPPNPTSKPWWKVW
ncbi:MAG: hypothetical protein ACKV2Q_15675 [Planctomycetaceae bacterium]